MMVQGRKYLDYDLEALHVFLSQQQQQQQSHRVVVAFQDSEAFESGLLTDLIALFQYVSSAVWAGRGVIRQQADCWQFLAWPDPV
jgi:hypothetical protein